MTISVLQGSQLRLQDLEVLSRVSEGARVIEAAKVLASRAGTAGNSICAVPSISPEEQISKLKPETRGITSEKTEGLGSYGLDTWVKLSPTHYRGDRENTHKRQAEASTKRKN